MHIIPKPLTKLLLQLGVEHTGICRYTDCLPLLPVRSAGRVPAEARSVILCLFPWNIGSAGEHAARNVARYAVLPDYHIVAGGILQTLSEALAAIYPSDAFVPFVDSSPLREVAAASLAGLGTIGRHGLLIHPVYGTRVFIGAVVTTLNLAPTPRATSGCLNCGQCFAACPTGALAPGRPLCLERCRSHITQKKGSLSAWEAGQIHQGGLVWGCDLCADACPMNTPALSPIRAFHRTPAPVLTAENLDALRRDKPYGYRGRAVLARNLCILSSGLNGQSPPH